MCRLRIRVLRLVAVDNSEGFPDDEVGAWDVERVEGLDAD